LGDHNKDRGMVVRQVATGTWLGSIMLVFLPLCYHSSIVNGEKGQGKLKWTL
jgi:hypothetical protein